MYVFLIILAVTLITIAVLIYLYSRKQYYINQAKLVDRKTPDLRQFTIESINAQINDLKAQKKHEEQLLQHKLADNEVEKQNAINSRINTLSDNIDKMIKNI